MTVEISSKGNFTAKEIHGYQVIGKNLKLTIKVGEKKTVERTAHKEITKIETELEEEQLPLSKNMIVEIFDNKKKVFSFNSIEEPVWDIGEQEL